uniref:SPOC domain-containing protein n=1 Tax=Strongyloides papillosus TaxID=174720 RepID=A0A0N5B325_STREA
MAPSTYTELCQSLGFISSNDCPAPPSCPPPSPPPPPCKPITIQYADSPKEYWMELSSCETVVMDNIESDEQGCGVGINSDTIAESVEQRNDVVVISDNADRSEEHLIDGNDDNALLDGSNGHQSDGGNMNDLLDEPDDHQNDSGDIAVIPGGSEARIVSESNRYFMPLGLSKTQDERITQTWSCVEKYDVVLNINIRGTVKAFEKYVHCLLTDDDVNIVLGRWGVSSMPRRRMIFHQYCPPLLAFSTDRRLKNGKICPKECLEWVNGRRSG